MTTRDDIFVDSSAWISLTVEKDSNHEHAVHLFQSLSVTARLYTSTFIVDESVTKIRKLLGQQDAEVFFFDLLRQERRKSVHILPVTKSVILQSVQILSRHPTPNTFSLTDASIIVLMKRYTMSRLLTFDGDFKRFRTEFQIIP